MNENILVTVVERFFAVFASKAEFIIEKKDLIEAGVVGAEDMPDNSSLELNMKVIITDLVEEQSTWSRN